MQDAESDFDQGEERVVRGGDDYVSPGEEVTEWDRFLESILRRSFGGQEIIFFRRNSLFLSAKEFPNGLRRGVSLLEYSVIDLIRYKTPESANLLKEEKCHKPSDDRESCGYCTRKEIRALLQKLAVAEQAGESLRRTRKCSPNSGSVPNTRSCGKKPESMSK